MPDRNTNRVALSFGDPAKLSPYENALRAVGLEPVRNPDSLEGMGGLCLAGGTDVDPALYGEAREPDTDEPDRERDSREYRLIDEAIAADMPVLAICRGLQVLNVALGGTLTQHLPHADAHRRRTPDPAAPVHDIVIVPGSVLSEAIGPEKHAVNSRHHQAIACLAPALRAGATSDDGIIEAAERPDKRFVIGVQWHPEDRIQCKADRRLFESFARAVVGT